MLEGKDADAAYKTGFSLAGTLVGDGVKKHPIKELGQQAIDTYIGKGVGAIKDGYFDYRQVKIDESNKLDLKIQQKK